MPRNRTDNGQTESQDSQPMDNIQPSITDQAETIELQPQDYSEDLAESTAITSQQQLIEEVSEAVVDDILSFREQLWASVGKKLRQRLILSQTIWHDSTQPSASPLPDGSGLDTSFSADTLPALPDASS